MAEALSDDVTDGRSVRGCPYRPAGQGCRSRPHRLGSGGAWPVGSIRRSRVAGEVRDGLSSAAFGTAAAVSFNGHKIKTTLGARCSSRTRPWPGGSAASQPRHDNQWSTGETPSTGTGVLFECRVVDRRWMVFGLSMWGRTNGCRIKQAQHRLAAVSEDASFHRPRMPDGLGSTSSAYTRRPCAGVDPSDPGVTGIEI